jgi:hypothetical protein
MLFLLILHSFLSPCAFLRASYILTYRTVHPVLSRVGSLLHAPSPWIPIHLSLCLSSPRFHRLSYRLHNFSTPSTIPPSTSSRGNSRRQQQITPAAREERNRNLQSSVSPLSHHTSRSLPPYPKDSNTPHNTLVLRARDGIVRLANSPPWRTIAAATSALNVNLLRLRRHSVSCARSVYMRGRSKIVCTGKSWVVPFDDGLLP